VIVFGSVWQEVLQSDFLSSTAHSYAGSFGDGNHQLLRLQPNKVGISDEAIFPH
jgi:hypothetical protein